MFLSLLLFNFSICWCFSHLVPSLCFFCSGRDSTRFPALFGYAWNHSYHSNSSGSSDGRWKCEERERPKIQEGREPEFLRLFPIQTLETLATTSLSLLLTIHALLCNLQETLFLSLKHAFGAVTRGEIEASPGVPFDLGSSFSLSRLCFLPRPAGVPFDLRSFLTRIIRSSFSRFIAITAEFFTPLSAPLHTDRIGLLRAQEARLLVMGLVNRSYHWVERALRTDCWRPMLRGSMDLDWTTWRV
ncbi:uncharacterized protein LOC18438829 isoform X1 [Amborella trichopoda]|uniref:uncharacterized protein LOC18438829 isoform X1 n=1 Tax=Amborella trichopoda TaxID=13333 RepID=UPI0009BE8244|nr:uncharacterized protein LOC18438829 isoform X1 [Amborella trichopoda]|eukprot:XP_020525821.1 uncharacterized protein LOC18438829 isoform X1 [Amborella trichopoda]